MRLFVLVAGCLAPTLVFGQQTYTNADLVKFQVPGAYTNQDLKRLPPLAVQKTPAATLPRYQAPPPSGNYQALYDSLARTRALLQAEIDYEVAQVDYSESPFAGDTRDFTVRLGHRTPATVIIRELTKRVALFDWQMEAVADEARRAGAPVERR